MTPTERKEAVEALRKLGYQLVFNAIADAVRDSRPLKPGTKNVIQISVKRFIDSIAAGPAEPSVESEAGETCETCQGNGEIVTDWERYLHPREGDAGDEAVAECPDCSGEGTTTTSPATPPAEAEIVDTGAEALYLLRFPDGRFVASEHRNCHPLDCDQARAIEDAATVYSAIHPLIAGPAAKAAILEADWLEAWIDREFTDHGVAIRFRDDDPIPGEPFMSMEIAKQLTRQAANAAMLDCADRADKRAKELILGIENVSDQEKRNLGWDLNFSQSRALQGFAATLRSRVSDGA